MPLKARESGNYWTPFIVNLFAAMSFLQETSFPVNLLQKGKQILFWYELWGQSWFHFLAVGPQVTWIINCRSAAVTFHRPAVTLPNYTAWWQRHTVVKLVRDYCAAVRGLDRLDTNSRSFDCKSDVCATRIATVPPKITCTSCKISPCTEIIKSCLTEMQNGLLTYLFTYLITYLLT